MGEDQLLLPHLGAQERILLDRIVASGADGVDRRDTHDWVLSRLIELRYAEESPLNDTAFVCTEAGRHRWQIEILADEQRKATALRRQLIRQRVDERFSKLGISTSTALTVYSPAEPRLHRGVPALAGPPQERLTTTLAVLFAAASIALVVILGSADPRDVQDWLFPPTLHAGNAPVDLPKATADVAALVAAPAAATVRAPVAPVTEKAPVRAAVSADAAPAVMQQTAAATVRAPAEPGIAKVPVRAAVSPDAVPAVTQQTAAATVRAPAEPGIAKVPVRAAVSPDAAPAVMQQTAAATVRAPAEPGIAKVPVRAAVSADAVPAVTQQSAVASIVSIAPSDSQPKQDARVANGTPATVGNDGRESPAIADAASPDDGAHQNGAVTAAALIDSVVSDGRQIATDLKTGVESGFRLIAAALLDAVADTNKPVSARDEVTQQAADDTPAPVALAAKPSSDRGPSATLQPVIAPVTAPARAAVVHGMVDPRVTAKAPPARADNADVDPQHAAVERLNAQSLSAARRGEVWRPDSSGVMAQMGQPL